MASKINQLTIQKNPRIIRHSHMHSVGLVYLDPDTIAFNNPDSSTSSNLADIYSCKN